MLAAAREASSFVAGRARAELDADRMLTLALLKAIEIIGEAGGRVSAECRAELNDIPWPNIVGMRNRLIHGYFDINLDIVWQTATVELLPLIAALESALATSDNS
jgi:uncharacterized protein with HEPN domain